MTVYAQTAKTNETAYVCKGVLPLSRYFYVHTYVNCSLRSGFIFVLLGKPIPAETRNENFSERPHKSDAKIRPDRRLVNFNWLYVRK